MIKTHHVTRSFYAVIRSALAIFAVVMISPFGNVRADLWIDGGFEGNEVNSVGWTGTDTFMGSNATNGAAAQGATFGTFVHDELVTESGTWVEDTRSLEGNRMFWLNDYDDPDTICVGHTFTNLVVGQTYELCWNFAGFNPVASTGSATDFVKPAVELSYRDNTNQFVVEDQVINFGSGGVTDPSAGASGTFQQFAMQDWDNLMWEKSTSYITIPDTQDPNEEFTIWVSYLSDTDPRNPLPASNISGMLIDNITFTAVPEPAVPALLGLLTCLAATRRRRS